MASMGKHSNELTSGQRTLATVIATLALLVSPLFFAVMFATVNHLLASSFGWLAWTVPVATELSFVILYLLEMLLEWLDSAPGWLRVAPYPFAVASLALNVYAAHGNVPGMIGHAVVTVAFFLPLIALKAAVHRLTASDEDRRRATAVADAIAHARDILRAADRWWRLRAPLMLRRQLRTRRLPAAVMEAINQGAASGGAAMWEPAVEAWITRSLVLPEGVSAQLAAARREAIESVPQRAPEASPETAPEVTPETASRAHPKPSAKPAAKVALKLTAAKSRSMSPERVAEHVSAMLEEYGDVSLNRVKADLSVGTEKAQAALGIARRETRNGTVVPMERRA
jgi:hypothetical protein